MSGEMKVSDPLERFAFGQNWQGFIEAKFTPERLEAARKELLKSLHLDSLEGKNFLDIGSGSGLHSLAALQSGASRIVSFDYDPVSVATTKFLHEQAGSPKHWSVLSGSVLDKDFMRSLEPADIVYSWGVLHHTGHTWAALENARIPLASNGVMFIALYSLSVAQAITLGGNPGPEEWLGLKQAYIKSPAWQRPLREWHCVWKKFLAGHCTSPLRLYKAIKALRRRIRDYREQSRGMDFWTDIRDWIGGWPMEYVRERDCFLFCRDRLGLELVWLETGRGNTEYIFRPIGTSNYWDDILAKRQRFELKAPFVKKEGQMWLAELPEECSEERCPADSLYGGEETSFEKSHLLLYEDDLPLDFPHAFINATQKFGCGRYRHTAEGLCFSTSDNSNPNESGRSYFVYF